MKKLIILITLSIALITTGCAQGKDLKIEYEELSKEQVEILTLTGNSIFKYKLRNLPNDKTYELRLVYEVYKNNEKVKEEDILGMAFEPTDEKLKDIILSMNIQDDKIRCIWGEYGGAYTSFDIEEDLENFTKQYFTKNTEVNFGEDIYLFNAMKGGNGFKVSDSGLLSEKDKNDYLKDHESNVFIKLVFEEK